MTFDSALTKTVVLRVYDDDDHKPADHLGEVSQVIILCTRRGHKEYFLLNWFYWTQNNYL